MSEVTNSPTTESRKVDHVRINLEENVSFPNLTTGLERYRFLHRAVPEVDLRDVDTQITLFGKTLSAPILISSMTGGAQLANKINRNLAIAAQKHNIAMGLGSQRAAIEDDELAYTFHLRDIAPNAMIFANVGAVQLNYGYGADKMYKAVEMAQADALILHFNVLQEAVQPEGDTNFGDLLSKIAELCSSLTIPVIAKEVGWGFSERDVRQLADAGVAAIDVAGSGGTSWSEVEYYRAPTRIHAEVARAFADWGIPTADAIQYARAGAPNLPVIASGGLRTGIDIAKCIALGAQMGGLAGPFLRAANDSVEAVEETIEILKKQLAITMQCVGATTIEQLSQTPLMTTKDS